MKNKSLNKSANRLKITLSTKDKMGASPDNEVKGTLRKLSMRRLKKVTQNPATENLPLSSVFSPRNKSNQTIPTTVTN